MNNGLGMNRTLKISFDLKNTYRVNTILYSLKQIPLVKKLLPEKLYSVVGLKKFANILSFLWGIINVFLWKILYFLTMIVGVSTFYKIQPESQTFLHILLLLTIIGGFINTNLFEPRKDKYYAMILMRMDAREYTIVNYVCVLAKTFIGFLPCTIYFGVTKGVPIWFAALLPVAIVAVKLCFVGVILSIYERKRKNYNENELSKHQWIVLGILLVAAYGLPAIGVAMPNWVSMGIFLLSIPFGVLGLLKVLNFKDYRQVNKELLAGLTNQMDNIDTYTQIIKEANEESISKDVTITSNRKGFEYLNELFVKRHKKILWTSVKRLSLFFLAAACGMQLFIFLKPEMKMVVNELVLGCLPLCTFLMYAINRGTNFTQALFINCDHSLLTYSFFKEPKFVLKLFQIRLREIMKINLLPAVFIGVGLAAALYTTGGTEDPVNYIVLIVAVISMSLFFSVHYLTVYYLLQPYNAGTEIKSGTYRFVMGATYFVCLMLMQIHVSIWTYGLMTIVFVVVYCILASALVYKFAPKTFKIRA